MKSQTCPSCLVQTLTSKKCCKKVLWKIKVLCHDCPGVNMSTPPWLLRNKYHISNLTLMASKRTNITASLLLVETNITASVSTRKTFQIFIVWFWPAIAVSFVESEALSFALEHLWWISDKCSPNLKGDKWDMELCTIKAQHFATLRKNPR